MTVPSTAIIRSRLRLRHLQLVRALIEYGSLRKASDEIGMTQPAATKALQELEALLGVTLFIRRARGTEPTAFCHALVRYANVMFADLDTLREELVAIESGNVGAVRVGSIMAPAPQLLAGAIVELKRAHPRLHVVVQIDTSDVLVQALRQDQLDIVLGRIPGGWPSDDLTFETLGEEPLSIVVRRDHKLSNKTSAVSIAELSKHPWIVQPHPSPMREIIDQTFRESRVALPSDIVETSSILTTLTLLQETDMLAVLPTSVAAYYVRQGILSLVPARFRGRLTPYGLILRANRRATPAAQSFIEAIRESAASG